MKRYKRKYFEDYNLPINIGSEILYGKFLNKRGIVKSFGKTDKNQPTVILEDGKEIPMLKIRIANLISNSIKEAVTPLKSIEAISFIYNHLKKQDPQMMKNKDKHATQVLIQRIIGLRESGHDVDEIAKITRESVFFVQLVFSIIDVNKL